MTENNTTTTTAQQQQQQQPPKKQETGEVHEDVVGTPEHAAAHPHTAVPPTRTIAIALDASNYSQHAFQWAMENIVRPETDQVVLLNVRPVVVMPAYYGSIYMDFSDEVSRFEEANKQESHNLLRAYAAKVPPHKYNMRGIALRGDAREEIAFKVDELKADMLVVGTRGLGAVKRVFLGSVSQYLVHHVACPVVIAHYVGSLDEKVKG